MTDRLFAECCYGTDWQHGENMPCPWDEHAKKLLERGDDPAAEAYQLSMTDPRFAAKSALDAER